MRRRALLLACVAACGGGGGGGGTGPSLDELQQASHDAQCAYNVRCGLFATTADCDAYLLVAPDPSAQAAVDAGKTKYDPGKAGQCFASIASASCDQTDKSAREIDDACSHIFTGTLQMGDTCASGSECASGNCSIPSDTGDCPLGTCGAAEVVANLGESCTIHQCAPGSFCDATQTCAHLEPQNTPCDFDTDCDYLLGCLGATGAKTCQPVPHIGSACPDMACAEVNATCDATSATCVALGLPGDACTTVSDCTFYGECDTTAMQCTNFPTLGAACTSVCTGLAWCMIPSGMPAGTCVAPQANGATCAGGDQCESSFCNAQKLCADPEVCI
jgi:hypothetical protein